MYESFFGLEEKPFDLTPNPAFLFLTPFIQEILAALIYGVTEHRGFIALVGDIGTGKTLMLHAMVERLDESVKVAYIFNPDITFKQILMLALVNYDIARPKENLSIDQAIQRLKEHAFEQNKKGGNLVIIVDEAQSLSRRTMDNLRMLSNIETHQQKLVQIVFAGQLELEEKFQQPEWQPLVQRIVLKRYSTKLTEKETYEYIQHRLKVAKFNGSQLFTRDALDLVYRFSEGIPRKINILCDNALLTAFGRTARNVDKAIIQEVLQDLNLCNESDHQKKTGSEDTDLSEEKKNNSEWQAKISNGSKKKIIFAVAAVLILICIFVSGWFFTIGSP